MKQGKSIKLSAKQKARLVDLYASDRMRSDVQETLAKEFNLTTRSIRNLARQMGIVTPAGLTNGKIMVYDIETSYVLFEGWSTGKTYNRWQDIHGELCTKIISISWKFLGSDKVHALTWDKDQCDKLMVSKFLIEYNKASMVVGYNNNSFDNKIINSRAWVHGLFVNTYITSFDLYRHIAKTQRHQSKSLSYLCKIKGLTAQKLTHRGKDMWRDIQFGTPKKQKEALKEMVAYNVGDIVSTEELYVSVRPYLKVAMHQGVKSDLPKWSCPNSGSLNVTLLDTTYTPAGTIQRILYCKESDTQFKVSNKEYMNFLQRAMTKHFE